MVLADTEPAADGDRPARPRGACWRSSHRGGVAACLGAHAAGGLLGAARRGRPRPEVGERRARHLVLGKPADGVGARSSGYDRGPTDAAPSRHDFLPDANHRGRGGPDRGDRRPRDPARRDPRPSELIVIRGAGHLPDIEQPDEFNATPRAFSRRDSDAGRLAARDWRPRSA